MCWLTSIIYASIFLLFHKDITFNAIVLCKNMSDLAFAENLIFFLLKFIIVFPN